MSLPVREFGNFLGLGFAAEQARVGPIPKSYVRRARSLPVPSFPHFLSRSAAPRFRMDAQTIEGWKASRGVKNGGSILV